MSVARHLKINLVEYDQRIRSFIPNYDVMLGEVATTLSLLKKRRPLIVDVGIGTGALSARCLSVVPHARIVGIDGDPGMLALAGHRLAPRLHTRLDLAFGDFLHTPFPRCDAVVATLAMHHVTSIVSKRKLYAKCFRALQNGGILVNGDCMPAGDTHLDRRYMQQWKAHMRRSYSARQVTNFLGAWEDEDTYFPLQDEIKMMTAAGFRVEVVWRLAPFAVVLGWKK